MRVHTVVFTRRNEVRYQRVDCPEPTADDVVVEVTHSWISSNTEGSFLRGERIGGRFPYVAGYQKLGIIEWVADVSRPPLEAPRSSQTPALRRVCPRASTTVLFEVVTL